MIYFEGNSDLRFFRNDDVSFSGCPNCESDEFLMDINFNDVWNAFEDVPISTDGEDILEADFLHFEVGVATRQDVWHWIEETYEVTLGEGWVC